MMMRAHLYILIITMYMVIPIIIVLATVHMIRGIMIIIGIVIIMVPVGAVDIILPGTITGIRML